MSEGNWIYFGTDPKCGHLVAAVVDSPEYKRDTAKTVAQMVRDGLEVTRRQDQVGLVWCSEECERMKEVRAQQERKLGRRWKTQTALDLFPAEALR